MIPLVDRMQKVTLRTVTMPIQSQQIITKDSVSIGVAAVAYFRRVDPVKSIVEIEDVESAIYEIAQTTVRNVVGRSTLDHVLSETETLNESIKEILDMTTERWGVLVQLVELKDIELPESMKRAMAREAEAEREKRAKIIAAEGEALSVGKLAEAADVIAAHPIALQLRNLQILAEVAVERNSTIIFPAQFLDSERRRTTCAGQLRCANADEQGRTAAAAGCSRDGVRCDVGHVGGTPRSWYLFSGRGLRPATGPARR
jgi:regulator of protease activity HflC (stomatin/prohibitin superfamily)